MKFLFVTDTHLTARGPASRTDNYVDAIMEKFEELKKVIQDEGITAVIHGGDLFDKPVVSIQLTGMVANFIKSTGVPWYVVPGNHDLFGYNIKSLPQTSLGLLSQAGVVTILDRQYGVLEFTNQHGRTISFEGQEYHMDIDHRDPNLDYYVTSQSDTKFLIPHSMLLDKEYFPDVHYTKTDALSQVVHAPDVILVGHFHDGYRTQYVKRYDGGPDIQIYNPGSMVRDEGSKGNLTREVQYVLIDYTNAGHPTLGTWDFDSHPFRCAKLGTQIFDRSHITEKQAKNRYLESFEKKLSDVSFEAVDVRDVLDNLITKDTSIDTEIATEARDRLVEAEQVIDDVTKQMTGYVEKPHNISITEIEIKGFQSHEDTTVHLSGGVNAIIGPSDSGKSAILRALRFALYNEPKGSDFLRVGAKSAEVTVRFSDGSEIKRSRTASSAGTYEIRDTKGEVTSLKGFSNNIPADVPNTHQMPYIQLTKDLEASLNIGYQLDSPFLIGESPGTRAAIIGRLTGVNLVDTAVREVGKEILGNTRDIKTMAGQIEDIDNQLLAFNDLDDIAETIDKANAQLSKIELHERMKQEYQDIQDQWNEMSQSEEDIQHELQQLQGLEKLAPKVAQLENWQKELTELRDTAALLAVNQIEENTLQFGIANQKQVTDVLTFLPELEQAVAECNGLKALQSDILSVTDEISEIIQALYDLPGYGVNQVIASLERMNQVHYDLTDLHSAMQWNRLTINDLRKEIRAAYLSEGKAMQEYQALLEEHGTCPTCNQTIQRGHSHAH